jgi:uncharacterized membrane protein
MLDDKRLHRPINSSSLREDAMSVFEYSIDVAMPLDTVYNQWAEFESYPYFMEGIRAVHQLSDIRLLWLGDISHDEREWFAEIVELSPNQRIAWKSTSGAKYDGVVQVRALDYDTTRVILQLDYDPRGFTENVPAALATIERRMAGDLKRFKAYIEDRSYRVGQWRGEAQAAFARM